MLTSRRASTWQTRVLPRERHDQFGMIVGMGGCSSGFFAVCSLLARRLISIVFVSRFRRGLSENPQICRTRFSEYFKGRLRYHCIRRIRRDNSRDDVSFVGSRIILCGMLSMRLDALLQVFSHLHLMVSSLKTPHVLNHLLLGGTTLEAPHHTSLSLRIRLHTRWSRGRMRASEMVLG